MSEQGMAGGFFKGFDKLFKGFKTAGGPLGIFINVLEALNFLEPILDMFVAFLEILSAGFAPILAVIIEALVQVIPYIQQISDQLLGLFEPMAPLVDEVFKAFLPLLGVFMNLISAVLVPMTPLLLQLTSAFTPLIVSFASFLTEVLTPLAPLLTLLIDAITPFLTFLTNIISDILGALDDGFQIVLDWFAGVWDRIYDKIEESFEAVGGSIAAFFTGGG